MTAAPSPRLSLPRQIFFGLAALLGLAALVALAQSVPSGPAPQQNTPTLHIQVPLVVEDIVVLDSHNQPVHGLKASDFTITDDGKPVTPQSFEEHAAPNPAQQAAHFASLPKFPDLGVNVFTNYTPTPPDSALNIILLDALNTPITDQTKVRLQLVKFLSTLPPGTPIAVFGLSSHLYLLQGFSSDPAILKAALSATVSGSRSSHLIDNSASGGPGVEADALGSFGLLAQANGNLSGALFDMQTFLQGEMNTYQIQQRTQLTLDAFDQLARYLSVLPGRKNLIWFSGSFPLNITPSAVQTAAAFSASSDASSDSNVTASMFSSSNQDHFGSAVRDMDDQLRRSQIAIYPVDARGLFTDSSMQAESNTALGTTNTSTEIIAGGKGTGPGTGSITMASDAINDFSSQTTEEHATMNKMADETGGKAFYNNGDFSAAVTSAIALGSNYYSVSYTPPSGSWDGKLHKIDVKINQRSLHLTYRRRYYADDPALDKDSHGKKHQLPSAMQAAMTHGAPAPSQLLFDVRVIPDRLTTYLLDPTSHPVTKFMKPPYHTYQLDTLLDIHFVQVTRATEPPAPPKRRDTGEPLSVITASSQASSAPPAAGGVVYKGTLQYTVLVYNADGMVVNSKARSADFSLTPGEYADLLAHGLPATWSIDVPVEGTYFIRIGIHDPASNNVGAVEIPVPALKSRQEMIAASTNPCQPGSGAWPILMRANDERTAGSPGLTARDASPAASAPSPCPASASVPSSAPQPRQP